jgi:hypothetical protein
MFKAKYTIGWSMIALLFVACKKDASYDITGDPEVKFFTNATGFGNAPQNSISYNVVNIPDVASSGLINLSSTMPAIIKVPVFATREVSEDVTIGAVQDNSLIADYNASHNTSYLAFPSGILNTSGLSARIAKGGSTSTDSLTIATDSTQFKILTGVAYIAPIRLTTVSNRNVGGITNNSTTQVVYILANVEQRRIKFLATTTDIQGALVTPRTSWTSIFSPTPTTIGSIFDGLTTTYSRWTTPVSPYGQLDVNIQASKNITGIRLYTMNSSTYVPTKVDVYLSSDGINYDLIGSPLKANLTFASNYNYILFYKAIPAQYIRLRLYYSTSTSSNNGRLTEFDVYAN